MGSLLVFPFPLQIGNCTLYVLFNQSPSDLALGWNLGLMSCRRDNLCIVSANRTRQMVLQYQKFFLLNLYPLCGLRNFCWLNQSLKTRGRGHSQHWRPTWGRGQQQQQVPPGYHQRRRPRGWLVEGRIEWVSYMVNLPGSRNLAIIRLDEWVYF